MIEQRPLESDITRTMNLDAIFFDLYGTLLVYGDMDAAWSGWLDALQTRIAAVRRGVTRVALERACDGFFSKPEPTTDGTATLTVYERRLERLCTEIEVAATPEDVTRMATETAAAWQRYVPPDPEARDVLSVLAERLPLVLVSNFDHPPHVRRLLEEAGLDGFFKQVIVSAEVGVKKPDPAIFQRPLRELDLHPPNVAYVGDSPEDMDAARTAGLVPVLVRRSSGSTFAEAADYGPSTRNRLPEDDLRGKYTVSSLREVVDLVFGDV
jgi:putative hydrolase of the HAD superfamily